jgi:tetratricopeptide (TPR) repeat protein
MLNTELAADGTLRMVSGEDVARAKSELPLRDEDSLGKSTLQRLRINEGADVVVVGSYTTLPNARKHRIRLDVRLQDTAGGETIAEEAVSGDENDLFDLVADLGGKLRQRLGAAPLSEEGAVATRAALPSNEKAARLYAEGRARLWAFDYFGARDLLNKAIMADPDFPLTHAALSDVWWHTGYDAKARVEARRALELSNHLSQEQRLLVEGQYQRTVQEWPKAVEAYRSLFRLFPDNLDYGLLFASAQMHLSAADSLHTLAGLRRLPSPLGDDARIDMTEASAWINRDFTKARAAAKLAIEKATARGSPVIVSRTYGILCQQDPAVSASAEAIGDCKNALKNSIAAKDPNGEAMMRTNLAALYYLRGDLAESAQMFQQAAKKFRQIGNRDGVATALSNFADTRLSQGDLMDAKKLLEESIPEYQAVDDKEGVVLNLDSLGDIWRQNGELDRAEMAYQQAETIARKIEDKNAIAYVLSGMGDLALDRGDLTLARERYEEALALRSQAGEKQSAAESRVSLAKLAIEEGHASDAEASVRACKQQFHQEQQADDELIVSTVLIEALLAQDKHSEAQKEAGASEPLATKSQNRIVRLKFDLASARMMLASDRPESSRQPLEQLAQDAHGHGFLGLELEGRVSLAELARKTGHLAAAEEQLTSLERAARSKGFGLIAGKAKTARDDDAKRGGFSIPAILHLGGCPVLSRSEGRGL